MLVSLVSAHGSPGVTATALGLALHWPRPVVLVDADPGGGSALLAGFFRGQVDQPGLVDLVIAHRSDLLPDAVPRLLFPLEGSKASVLFGARSHEQAGGVAALWQPVLEVLRDLDPAGPDVIVDGGRLGWDGWPRALVEGADVTLLTVGSDLPSLAAARSWAAALAAEDAPVRTTRLLLVGEGRPYTAREVSRTLGLAVLGSIEWSPALAQVYSHGERPPVPRWWRRIGHGPGAAADAFEASGYVRSLHAVAAALQSLSEPSTRRPFRSVLARADRKSVV